MENVYKYDFTDDEVVRDVVEDIKRPVAILGTAIITDHAFTADQAAKHASKVRRVTNSQEMSDYDRNKWREVSGSFLA